MSVSRKPEIAVLIPCYNEALTIAKVVGDFRREPLDATIYVYDNNSRDGDSPTSPVRRRCGRGIRAAPGKGFVIQSMFRDVIADVYVMVDGDDTYPAASVHELLKPVLEGHADLVVGNRLVEFEKGSYRGLHVFGNHLVVNSINFIFKAQLHDVMSGYRAFNRRLVQSVPAISRGFEVETELTLQTLYRNLLITEIPIHYGTRPEGSFSKLSTFRDGAKVLLKIKMDTFGRLLAADVLRPDRRLLRHCRPCTRQHSDSRVHRNGTDRPLSDGDSRRGAGDHGARRDQLRRGARQRKPPFPRSVAARVAEPAYQGMTGGRARLGWLILIIASCAARGLFRISSALRAPDSLGIGRD